MKRVLALILIAAALPVNVGCRCMSGPMSHDTASPDRAEALAGSRAARKVEERFGGVIRDASFEHRAERIAQRLRERAVDPPPPCRVRLLDSATPNAISLPGGRIYVTLGLYERLRSDALLAAVIAHEMAHLAAGDHFAERSAGADAALAVEIRADVQAARYLIAAGFDADALIDLLEIIRHDQPTSWADARVARLAALSG
ncbi:MAG: M48 family metallopeptidase [Phycisphaerae bacterium]|nr:M48 family metallopeptidase [Phycisphaerae bacterium]